jgi:hypothetical protein
MNNLIKVSAAGAVMCLACLATNTGGTAMAEEVKAAQTTNVNAAIDIGSRLELMVDDFLIARMDGVRLQLQTPKEAPVADSPLNEKETVASHYATVIKDGGRFRLYYRTYYPGYKGPHGDGNPGEITCYAESVDGIQWQKPNLDLIEINGSRSNNVILHEAPFCHNFSPFLDTRPEKDRGKRFKALAGIHPGGLYAFESEDGNHWAKMQNTPVITSKDFAFDSQNVAFWSEAEGCYVCYFRNWSGDLRSIGRTTSRDFLHWSAPVATIPNLLGEHLYASQTHPYFRAPHIYIALPTRFLGDRGDTTDIMFMTWRTGSASFTRYFKEAFIRPGLAPERWGNRSNYVALNVVPLSPSEMCIYHSVSGHRYILRTDGFASAHAGAAKGELLTKPFTFAGSALYVNFSTSAAGHLCIEIQDKDGHAIPGYALADCKEIIGDEIERVVAWKDGADVARLAGQTIRLRVEMKDADLYSFRFRKKDRE